jgi:hypothetical protein
VAPAGADVADTRKATTSAHRSSAIEASELANCGLERNRQLDVASLHRAARPSRLEVPLLGHMRHNDSHVSRKVIMDE